MRNTPWTEAERVQVEKMLEEGRPIIEITRASGRSYESIRCVSRKWRARTAAAPAEEVQAIQQSGQAAQIEQLQREILQLQISREPQRVPTQTAAVPVMSTEQMWQQAEEEGERRIAYTIERSKFSVSFDEGPIGISFISDQHIGPGTPCDFRRMREDAELIKATPGLYACLGGDGVDNHCKHRAAAIASRSKPHDQWNLFEYYLSIFAEKIVAMISGNHDAFTEELAGVDVLAQIARRQKLCYAPAEARIAVKVGQINYDVALRHQYRFNSSLNQGHAVKQWLRMGDAAFDIGCIGHHHESHVESFTFHGLKRYVCRPGSYQLMSGWSFQYGYNFSRPTCPTFILDPQQRRILAFDDVRDAIKTLAAERGSTCA